MPSPRYCAHLCAPVLLFFAVRPSCGVLPERASWSVPPPKVERGIFPSSAFTNSTLKVNAGSAGGEWAAASGSLAWPGLPSAAHSTFTVVPTLLTRPEVDRVLSLLEDVPFFDEDRDSVDSAPTFEFYLSRDGGIEHIAGKPDADPVVQQQRAPVRARLSALLEPIVSERVLPIANALYPSACAGTCRVCHSLVRRWRSGERTTHATHFDIQALVTVVVSLSSHGVDFDGGLYLSTGGVRTPWVGDRALPVQGTPDAFLALQAGDGVVHQSTLLHGVDVTRGSRMSWVLWLKDAPGGSCASSDPSSWNAAGAAAGDPLAQFLHARRAPRAATRAHWLQRAAEGGYSRAANEWGMALQAGDGVAANASASRAWLERAAAAGEPDALFNLGVALREEDTVAAVGLFRAAAAAGQSDAFANLAVALFNGVGGVARDVSAAMAHWERAGDGPSLMHAARVAAAGTDAAPPSPSAATALLRRSCAQGHAPACIALADDAIDAADEAAWLTKAHRAGDRGAGPRLRQLRQRLAAAAVQAEMATSEFSSAAASAAAEL